MPRNAQHSNAYGKSYKDTDEESGLEEVDIRKVDSDDPEGDGYETSFLIVSPVQSNDMANEEASWLGGDWLCRPYRRELLMQEINNANRRKNGHGAILNSLKNAGIMIFIIDGKVSINNTDIIDSIQNVIRHITNEQRMRPATCVKTMPKCLLYRDQEGRFFNLTLPEHTISRAGAWESNISTFSCVQALSVLTILCRSFACTTSTDVITSRFQPAYLSLILGLVFSEEIGMSWTNVGMFVRGMPSLSAYNLMAGAESDWIKKILLLCLALGGVATGNTQWILTTIGISMTCLALLANVGARAWRFLEWRPMTNGATFEPALAFLAAVGAGLALPFLGHRTAEAGDQAAMESVLRIALMVAACFILSDYDDIQRFLVIGSEHCSQDYVNLCVGAWYAITLIASLFVSFRREQQPDWPEREEPLLESNHLSPVGFLVPGIPSFPIDPKLAKQGTACFNRAVVLGCGVFTALVLGGIMCFSAFTSADEDFGEDLQNGNVVP